MKNGIQRIVRLVAWIVVIGMPVLAEQGAPAADGPAGNGGDQGLLGSPGAEERMGQAYVRMIQAEQARLENPARARDHYEEALGLLESIETDYPGWYTQVVRHRILSCESAIEKLKSAATATGPAESESKPIEPVPLLGDLDLSLSAGAAATTARALQAGIEERDANLAELRGEIRNLKEENRRLTAKLTKCEGRKSASGKTAGDPTLYPAVLRAEARRLVSSGLASNAVPLLLEMRELMPEDAAIPQLLGVAYCQLGAFPDALRELEPLIGKGRPSADSWMAFGVACLGIGNLGRARHAFEKALDRDPNLAEAHFNLAQILIRMEKPDTEKALLHYRTALQLGTSRDSQIETALQRAMLYERARKMKK